MSVMAAAGGAQGAGALLQSYGTLQEGYAQGNAAEFNQNVAHQNVQLARAQAKEQERRLRVQTGQALGQLRTAYGASGVTAEGSALDVLESSAANAELDALTVRHGGEVKAVGFQNEANLQGLYRKAAIRGGRISAASSLLMNAGKAAQNSYGTG